MKIISVLLFVMCPAFYGVHAQALTLNSYIPAKATVFIDFDGQYVTGTAWNYSGDINAAPAALDNNAIAEIVSRVSEDYRPFDLNITTDSTVYWNAPRNKRMRVIVSSTYQWYGSTAGGVAYVGSFTWGDNTPAFVFASLLGNRPKWVAEAISHEVGHTLGLQHQSSYDANCTKTAEYNTGTGSGEIGWAPIMGAGYYQNHTTWHTGSNTAGCSSIQNDFDIISTRNGLGLRADDHGDSNETATTLNVFAGGFTASGIINTSSDVDVFRLVLDQPAGLQLTANPQNVGTGDDGANVDIQITLLHGTDTIQKYNPLTLLNAGVDTNLNAGTYYFVVDGVGNMYHNDVGSLGLYTLAGNILQVLAVKDVKLTGAEVNGVDQLYFTNETGVNLEQLTLETSSDGERFRMLATLPSSASAYAAHESSVGTTYYRLRWQSLQGKWCYSSVLMVEHRKQDAVRIIGFSANNILIQSNSAYTYELYDISGRVVSKGQLAAASNSIFCGVNRGVLVLNCHNARQSFTQKLIKR